MLPWLDNCQEAAATLALMEVQLGADWRSRFAESEWAHRNAVAQPLLTGLSLAAWQALAPSLPAPEVVAGYSDGWMGTGVIGYSWPDAYRKCEKSVDIIKGLMQERGIEVDETNVEYIGYNSLLGANADPAYRDHLNECFLRMTIRTQDKRVADVLTTLGLA